MAIPALGRREEPQVLSYRRSHSYLPTSMPPRACYNSRIRVRPCLTPFP
jgi:hypothetical protein